MTKKLKADRTDGLVSPGEAGKLIVDCTPDEKAGRTLARAILDPQSRNASLAIAFGSKGFGDGPQPDLTESAAALGEEIARATNGDLSLASRIYTSHAVSLDTLFTEFARRSGLNLGQYPEAAERYMRLALKTQAACRSTLEALAKLHQPREQTVKHVHVNQGGQAVVADTFHQHPGGPQNGKAYEQSDATGGASQRAALPSPDANGSGVPIPGREGTEAVPNARRDQSGGT